MINSGAGSSAGRTSWSGKPEQNDYSSMAGFLAYYLQQLKPDEDLYRLETIQLVGNELDQNDVPTNNFTEGSIELLLAGYSYGSLILARMQPISTILHRLEAAEMGTAGAELILRARTLARQTRLSMDEMYSPSSPRGRQQLRPDDASPTKQRVTASPITMGGEETDPSTRRRSRDSRRSMDFIRKSVEMPQRIKAHMKRSSTPVSGSPRKGSKDEPATPVTPATPATPKLYGVRTVPAVKLRYLIISPVLLPFTQTLCPPGPPNVIAGLRRNNGDSSAGASFLNNPTLLIFGSSDGFTAARRLKSWAEKMCKDSSSSFEWHEIEGAGHFWREVGVMQALQAKVSASVNSADHT